MASAADHHHHHHHEVILLDNKFSYFSMRVRIALKEKGIAYESREQDLANKTGFLLEMNPVHKKVPVLIHKGKPICESLIILQYIDEVWNENSPHLLPMSDPYERARAFFWADCIVKKIEKPWEKMLFAGKGTEGLDAAVREVIEGFHLLEVELGDKPYFGGKSDNNIGIIDIILIPYCCFFYTLQKLGNRRIEEECPKLVAWAQRCLQKESVSTSLADQFDCYGHIFQLRQMMGIN